MSSRINELSSQDPPNTPPSDSELSRSSPKDFVEGSSSEVSMVPLEALQASQVAYNSLKRKLKLKNEQNVELQKTIDDLRNRRQRTLCRTERPATEMVDDVQLALTLNSDVLKHAGDETSDSYSRNIEMMNILHLENKKLRQQFDRVNSKNEQLTDKLFQFVTSQANLNEDLDKAKQKIDKLQLELEQSELARSVDQKLHEEAFESLKSSVESFLRKPNTSTGSGDQHYNSSITDDLRQTIALAFQQQEEINKLKQVISRQNSVIKVYIDDSRRSSPGQSMSKSEGDTGERPTMNGGSFVVSRRKSHHLSPVEHASDIQTDTWANSREKIVSPDLGSIRRPPVVCGATTTELREPLPSTSVHSPTAEYYANVRSPPTPTSRGWEAQTDNVMGRTSDWMKHIGSKTENIARTSDLVGSPRLLPHISTTISNAVTDRYDASGRSQICVDRETSASDRSCPLCYKKFDRYVKDDDYHQHVIRCLPSEQSSSALRQSDQLKQCPVCQKIFNNDISQHEFVKHVNDHFPSEFEVV